VPVRWVVVCVVVVMSVSPRGVEAGLQSPSGRVGARRGGPNQGPMSQPRDGGGPMVGPIPATRPTPETTDRMPHTTNRLPRRRIGLRSQRIERRADTSGARADIPVPEAGGRIPLPASSTPTRAAGPPSRRADCRSWRTTRGANDSSGEGAGPWPERADGSPSRRLSTPSGPTRRGGSRSLAAGAIPGPEQTFRQPEQRISGPRSRFAGRDKQILGRATRSTPERRLAASAPSNPCQFTVLGFPTTIRSFHSRITLQRRTALAYAPLPMRRHLGFDA
jgi:hypothetical protein